RFVTGQVVQAGAAVGVDDAEGGRLVLQIDQDAHQHDVLDDVGKSPGVKGVTVVHWGRVTTSRDESNPASLRAAQAAKQSSASTYETPETLDCFGAYAPRNDEAQA